MADSTTTNLLLTKPEVGASTDTWGTKINTDLDSVDAVFAAAGTGTSVGLNVGSGKTLKVAGTTDFSANLTFTGTGNRITGDFSNATAANRIQLQSSTSNGQTGVIAIPNGTSTNVQFEANSDSSGGTNASVAQMAIVGGSEARFQSGIRGTGTYLPMTFYTGGFERIRVDTSGNVGIGTSSPVAPLDVNGTIVTRASGGEGGQVSFNNPDNASAGLTVDVSSADTARVFQTRNNSLMQIGQLAGTGGIVTLYTAASERARIDASGNLLVGTTSVIQSGTICSKYDGQIRNGIMLQTTFASAGTGFIRFLNSSETKQGEISANTTTTVAYGTSSDYRLKNTIAPMTGALAKVSLLKPCTYKWNADGSDGQGFIAHELQEVCPDAVIGEKDAVNEDGSIDPQGIDTSFLVATLTAAIQELKAIVDAQAVEIAALKGTA